LAVGKPGKAIVQGEVDFIAPVRLAERLSD
jgi:hypothetical protein